MEYLIGLALGLGACLFAALVGLDRDRAFYPTLLAMIASYYGLFAVMGDSMDALVLECVATLPFVVATVIGFRRNLWIVVAGLMGHGVFDYVHGHLIANPGVPAWWSAFCLSFDVAAAGVLAWLLRSRVPARPRTDVEFAPSGSTKG